MSAAEFVEEAQMWARRLEEHEAQGSTLEAARYRLQVKFGIPVQAFWALRHRPPKRIAADLYHSLRLAYLNQCQRVVQSARTDIGVLKTQGFDDADTASLELEAQNVARAVESARGGG